MRATSTVLALLMALMATSAFSGRVKRDKGQHQHAPIGAQSYAQAPQSYAPQRPLPVPLPIPLSPHSLILPSPPAAGGGSSYLSGSASSQAPYLGPHQPPQQPPQYNPAPQQVAPPAPAPYQPPPQILQQPWPVPIAFQSAPPPQQQQPHETYVAPPAITYQAPQPAPQVQQPWPAPAAPSAPVTPLHPLPLYARGPQGSQAPPPPHHVPHEAQQALEYGQDSGSQQAGGYVPSPPVTIPPVHVGEPVQYGNEGQENQEVALHHPVDVQHDHDIQTNAIAGVSAAHPGGVSGGVGGGVSGGNASQWTEGSIPSTLEKMGFNTLNDLLILAGLDETMDKEGPFTVLVPVDQAFEILIQRFGGMEKATEEFNKNPEVLTSLLKHHVIPGIVPSSALEDNMVEHSLLGTPLRVKFYESEDMEWRPLKVVTVNGARLIHTDIKATNGHIHIVDRVIFPVPQAATYQTLKADPQQRFSTFVSALERTGVAQELGNPQAGPYTVFAPSDKAFALISRAELNGILNDPERLSKLVKRHVVQDLVYTSGLQGFQKAYALDFEILYIYHAKSMTKVNGANVVEPDVTTLNGVVHIIDSVLGVY